MPLSPALTLTTRRATPFLRVCSRRAQCREHSSSRAAELAGPRQDERKGQGGMGAVNELNYILSIMVHRFSIAPVLYTASTVHPTMIQSARQLPSRR